MPPHPHQQLVKAHLLAFFTLVMSSFVYSFNTSYHFISYIVRIGFIAHIKSGNLAVSGDDAVNFLGGRGSGTDARMAISASFSDDREASEDVVLPALPHDMSRSMAANAIAKSEIFFIKPSFQLVSE